jgi:hypothetical protein
MEKVGIFNGQLEFLGAMLYFKWTFGSILFVVWYIFPRLVHCAKKNLAALRVTPSSLGLSLT